MELFNHRNLNQLEVRKQYQIEISKKFVASEILNDSEDTNRGWENIKEGNETSTTKCVGLDEWRQYKPWVGDECLRLLYQRKQAKMQWI